MAHILLLQIRHIYIQNLLIFSYSSMKSYVPASVAQLDVHLTSGQDFVDLTPAGLATFFHGN